jgi:dTDP-L-rhamnose 4-epimerase
MRALVTGGAGFIGSHLVDRLLAEGFQVRVLDNLDPKIHPRGRPAYLPSDVDAVRGSVTDPTTVESALRDVDVVFHQAAYQDYMPDFSRFLQVNAVSTALIFETIVKHRLRVKKIVVASSQAVYGEGQYQCPEHGFFLPIPRGRAQLEKRRWDVVCPECSVPAHIHLLREQYSNPYNQYAVSKLAQEKTALGLGWLYEIPTVALRYSITQGPRQSLYNHYSGVCRIFFSRALRKLPLIIYEDGNQSRDFVHVQDVVDANLCVLQTASADFEVFNVGSGKATTVLDYAAAVQARLNSDVGVRITGEYRRGDNRNSVSSIEKLSKLGWKPQRDTAAILDDFLCWIESIGGVPDDIPDAYTHMQATGVIGSSAAPRVTS